MTLKPLKDTLKPRIGLYSIGLDTYWSQFDGLENRLKEYGNFIKEKMSLHSEIYYFGLVDNVNAGHKAGEYFNEKNVDLIFCHSATYALSSTVLAVHKICKAPVVVLNLQPTAQINYEKTNTGEWLAHCGACPVPEISNMFNRSGISFRVVNGLLGLNETPKISMTDENTSQTLEAIKAWKEIYEWIEATKVIRNLKFSKFGFLGNYYSGMLDMYSDFTMLGSQIGITIEILEVCDLNNELKLISESEITEKLKEIKEMFLISDDSPSDLRVKKPTEEQLRWSATVASAQEKMVTKFKLDALSYYYHSNTENDYEKLQGGFIVGHSLLTAKKIPCAGEGDIKTNIAMKIADILDIGGSFSEIVVVDYKNGTILMGHDGPFHIAISDGKPILRGMDVFHGKKGTGISVEAKVKSGEVTIFAVTQTIEGKIKFIISEGISTDNQIMTIGNTQTHIKFDLNPDSYMDKWFKEAPTHHCALTIGHNANVLKKVGDLMGIETAVI